MIYTYKNTSTNKKKYTNQNHKKCDLPPLHLLLMEMALILKIQVT